MKTKFLLLISGVFLLSNIAFTQDKIYIKVGEAKIKKSVVAIADFKNLTPGFEAGEGKAFSRNVKEIINSDLNFTNLFTLQSTAAFIEKSSDAGLTLETFKLSDWSSIGTEFLVKSGLSLNADSLAFEVRVYNVALAKQVLGKRYIAKMSEPKILAHTVANDIVEALTGKPGIFFTKIAMVCEKSGQKEIWVTEFDGSNPKQLTNHKTLAFAPAWNKDNRKIAYSVYMRNAKNIKNIDLYELDLSSRKSRLLSNRKGINSGAVYSPVDNTLALTMSFLGNPEIFSLNSESLEVTRLTKSLGFDVDPSFSPDGKKLAYVSSRSGQPHVYLQDLSSGNSNRLTFAGKYNATPDWAPSGEKIVFAGYLESHFDLFLMNPDGTALERLTKNEGNNEDPRFSPDSNFITFSSNRSGQKNVYIISVDGLYTKRISFGLGNCTAPRWSNASKTPIGL